MISDLEPAIPYLLFSSLLLMMIDLNTKNGFKSFKKVELVMVFVVVNFITAPFLAAIWAFFLFENADPYYAVGFILNVAIPCSGVAAIWTGYAKGRVTSALALMPLSLASTIFIMPLMMWLLTGHFVQIQMFSLFYIMLIIVLAPFVIKQIIRKLIEQWIGLSEYEDKFAPVFQKVSGCGVLLVTFIIIASQTGFILSNLKWMFLIAFGIGTPQPFLAVICLFFSKSAATDYADCMALIFSGTAKNYAISISIATLIFGGTCAVFPVVIAPAIQMPLMFCILKASNRIQGILQEQE